MKIQCKVVGARIYDHNSPLDRNPNYAPQIGNGSTLHILWARVQAPVTNEFQAILFVESFKLVPRPLDKVPRPKSGKLSQPKPIWHPFCWRENELVWSKNIAAFHLKPFFFAMDITCALWYSTFARCMATIPSLWNGHFPKYMFFFKFQYCL